MSFENYILPIPSGQSIRDCESFGSYIFRVSRLNHCPPERLFSKLLLDSSIAFDNPHMTQLICAERLYQRGVPSIILLMAATGWGKYVRWCPECVNQKGKHHLLQWQLSHKCSHHQCLLINSCQTCGFETDDVVLWFNGLGCPCCKLHFGSVATLTFARRTLFQSWNSPALKES